MSVVGTLRVCGPSFGFVCDLVVLPLRDVGALDPFDVVGKVGGCEPVVGRGALVGGLCESLFDIDGVIGLEKSRER